MPLVDTIKDREALSMTMVSEFAADPVRVWQIWEDPRQLEQWWGPPEWPATFYDHDFTEGGRSKYFMTGPDGTKMHGWWKFTTIVAPRSLGIDDGFADDSGEPSGDLGTTKMSVALVPIATGTRMTMTSQFESVEQLEEMLAMGMEQGMQMALRQIDAILVSQP